MDDQSGPAVRQHARMAIKGGDPQESGDFGVESPFKPVGGETEARKKLKDHERAIPKTRGFHPEPDHGDY